VNDYAFSGFNQIAVPMHLPTHILSGWCVANSLPTSPRQRLFAMLAATLADLDGLGYVVRTDWFVDYHHVLTHNLWFGLLLSVVLAAFSPARSASLALYFALFNLHIVFDFLGSGPEWKIAYFWPVSPHGYRWDIGWAFDAWPNKAVFGVFFLWTVVIAAACRRTPLETVMPGLDRQLVGMLSRKHL
jgi:inner membrane protein